jgi:N-acetylmuramoyl-L-alanine amidase
MKVRHAASHLPSLAVLVLVFLAGEMQEQKAATLNIIDKPIPFGDLRRELTLDYIREHYDPQASGIDMVPRMVVIHWTASSSLQSVFAAFAPEKLPLRRFGLRRGGIVNVSTHFVVGRDGGIFRLMPETWMARHIIGLNHLAIGIENVGGPRAPLTPEQLVSDAALVRELVARYPTIDYLIGHHEYLRFRETPLWIERDNSYSTRKQDPGDDFMHRLRAALQDLGLKAAWSEARNSNDRTIASDPTGTPSP